MDPSQKLATLQRTLQKNQQPLNRPLSKIRNLKTDPKIKNYNIFYACFATNEFTRKLLKNFSKLCFFTEKNFS